ncbi:MAG TPA: hypothetical protein ENK44_12230 [Caldithrix abyssi]|uniref:TonB C-terminal domain-containing protein n=1 Tax=Caldithrix abyssi TaxID=187145 RepID=A0A7V4U225_CALAY|nr:hypothetical protein [Caldithrix abyssi]
MKKDSVKHSYKIKLEYSFILVLTGLIVVLFLFPRGEIIPPQYTRSDLPVIEVIEIPRTVQKKLLKRPRPTKPAIPVAAEEIELLDQITIDYSEIEQNKPGEGISDISFTIRDRQPRQLVEVVPEEIDEEIRGVIVLSLKIGRNGKILQHKVIKNSTRSERALQKVLRAAYRSRWEPAIFSGKTIEFWIEKTYVIN